MHKKGEGEERILRDTPDPRPFAALRAPVGGQGICEGLVGGTPKIPSSSREGLGMTESVGVNGCSTDPIRTKEEDPAARLPRSGTHSQ